MDFNALLKTLEGIQGKFLLSSFRNAVLMEFARRNGWDTVKIRLSSSMTQGHGRTVREDYRFLRNMMTETLAKRIISIVLITAGISNDRVTELTGLCDRNVRKLQKK
jgi:hypothetical protein